MTTTIISQGSVIHGQITEVKPSHHTHKRAWVVIVGGTNAQKMAGNAPKTHRAVAYCRASSTGKPVTTTDDWEKVNCPTCKSIREGRGGL